MLAWFKETIFQMCFFFHAQEITAPQRNVEVALHWQPRWGFMKGHQALLGQNKYFSGLLGNTHAKHLLDTPHIPEGKHRPQCKDCASRKSGHSLGKKYAELHHAFSLLPAVDMDHLR